MRHITEAERATLDARVAAQDARDAELRAQRYTGVERCLDTGDFAGWLNGHQVTWGRTYTETESKLSDQMAGNSWAAAL